MSERTAPMLDANPRTPELSVVDEVAAFGYAVRPLLPADLVGQLLEEFETLDVPVDAAIYRSFMDESRPVARRCDQALKDVLAPLVEDILPGRVLALATYCYKGTGAPGVEYHQDWTFVDERSERTLALWIPLIDAGVANGGLAVIPGSHRWTAGIRASAPMVDSPIIPHQEAFAQLTVAPHLPPGTAIIYDSATVHGSPANGTGRGRPAIILQTVPAEQPIVHFHQTPELVEGFVVDHEYFSSQCYGERPEGYPAFEPWTRTVLAGDFVEPLRFARQRSRPRVEDAPVPDPGGSPRARRSRWRVRPTGR